MHLARFRSQIIIALASSWLLAGSASADETIYERILHSTGFMIVSRGRSLAYGTCWIVDAKQKQVVTNAHVVRGATKVEVYFPLYENGSVITRSEIYLQKNKSVEGKVLFSDPDRDLALVELDSLPDGLKSLELARADCEAGEMLYSVGNSDMAGRSMSNGSLWRLRVGNAKRVLFQVWTTSGSDGRSEAVALESDLGHQPGDSGGPVVNARGQLVAVTSSFASVKCISIDRTEVAEFLSHARNGGTTAKKNDLLGSWMFEFDSRQGNNFFHIRFLDNSTLIWHGKEKYNGTYDYAGGTLHLMNPALRISDTIPLNWQDENHFTFRSDGSDFKATRR